MHKLTRQKQSARTDIHICKLYSTTFTSQSLASLSPSVSLKNLRGDSIGKGSSSEFINDVFTVPCVVKDRASAMGLLLRDRFVGLQLVGLLADGDVNLHDTRS
jgi:hypothetical protein